MLTFFRRIRQGLLDGDRTLKYVLYAIGEIALVVIGILIALQINNWNEWRKERAYEYKVLAEINSSIERDIEELTRMANLCQFLKEDAEEGLRILNSNNLDKDSLADILGSNIQLDITFQYSSFESLKSRGLDRLSVDSIRISLSKLYDQSYRKIEQYLDNYNQQLRGIWKPYLGEITRIVNKNGGLYNYPLNYSQIKNDHKVASLLESRWFMMDRYISYMMETIEECKRLSDIISKKLEDQDS